jgi:hypothetical protein
MQISNICVRGLCTFREAKLSEKPADHQDLPLLQTENGTSRLKLINQTFRQGNRATVAAKNIGPLSFMSVTAAIRWIRLQTMWFNATLGRARGCQKKN